MLPAVLLVVLLGQSAETADAEALFKRHASRVVQVRVTSEGSGAKAVIGTGFFVSSDGRVVTNYHVVSQLVFHPDRFRCKVLESAGTEQDAQVLDIDVVHDVAVLGTRIKSPSFFTLKEFELAQGARVYSLGNPHDVGLSIVEGTYNGLRAETLYDRIHFTGSLNPGMSGGPAIDRGGRVVGVNVASMGNQLSFLVPVRFARSLAERVRVQGGRPLDMLKERVQEELLQAQQELTDEMLHTVPPSKTLGRWTVPGRWVKGLREWGTQSSDEDDPWVVTSYSASSEDAIYVDSGRYAGALWMKFTHVQGRDISSPRLYYRWGRFFGRSEIGEYAFEASHETATNWSCRTEFVRGQNGAPMRVAFCMRACKPFDGLYDVLVRSMSFSQPDALLIGELGLGGVSGDNGRAVVRRFLEGIAWKR